MALLYSSKIVLYCMKHRDLQDLLPVGLGLWHPKEMID